MHFCHWSVILCPKGFKSSEQPEKMRQAGDGCSENGWGVKVCRRRKMDVAGVMGIRRSELGLCFGGGGGKWKSSVKELGGTFVGDTWNQQ